MVYKGNSTQHSEIFTKSGYFTMTNKKGIFSASQGERKDLLRSSKTKLKKYHKSWNKQTSVPVFPPGSLHVSVCTEQPGSAMEYLGSEVKQEP